MDTLLRVAFMTLQGMSTVIIDIFYVFAAIIALLSLVRFRQFNLWAKGVLKKPTLMIAEWLVQGILMATVLNLLINILGLPVVFSDYLYLILPVSFLIGFYHVKYTNMAYAVFFIGLISLVFSGQSLGSLSLPTIDFDITGMVMVTGMIYLALGITLLVSGTSNMMPMLYTKDDKKYLSYVTFRFWTIPLVLMVSVQMVMTGDTIAMPNWWPLIKLGNIDLLENSLLMLPLLLIINHSGVALNEKPDTYIHRESITKIISGLLMVLSSVMVRNFDFGYIISFLLILTIIAFEHLYAYDQSERNFKGIPLVTNFLILGFKDKGHKYRGYEAGDQIVRFNDIQLEAHHILKNLFDETDEDKVVIERIRLGQKLVTSHEKNELLEIFKSALWLPKNADIFYEFKFVKNLGLLHMINSRMKIPK